MYLTVYCCWVIILRIIFLDGYVHMWVFCLNWPTLHNQLFPPKDIQPIICLFVPIAQTIAWWSRCNFIWLDLFVTLCVSQILLQGASTYILHAITYLIGAWLSAVKQYSVCIALDYLTLVLTRPNNELYTRF